MSSEGGREGVEASNYKKANENEHAATERFDHVIKKIQTNKKFKVQFSK